MDVVSVSGLAIARFRMIENELQTVIELWEHQATEVQVHRVRT
jgi:hypothetical protein